LLKSFLLFKATPFQNAWIHMHVVDEEGRKISKSVPETWIDPHGVMDKFGTEAFRIWSGLEGNITKRDIRCSFDRIEGTSKFLTKIWNIARFISSFPQVTEGYELAPLDKIILANLNHLIRECREGYEEMNVFTAASGIRTFTWNIFADHYVEEVKSRAYNRGGMFTPELQRGAWFTLHRCLETILKLLAPIVPFITEALWLELYSNVSIHTQGFPEEQPEWDSETAKLLPKLIEFDNTIWRFKKSEGLALSQELAVPIYAPLELEPLAQDLKAMHRISKLQFGKPESGEDIEKLAEDIFAVKRA